MDSHRGLLYLGSHRVVSARGDQHYQAEDNPLRLAALFALLAGAIHAQNPRHVISGHPRLMLNDTIADTWEPSKTRLTAVTERMTAGGNATAIAEFNTLKAGITNPTPSFGESSNEEGNMNRLLNYAFAYMILHKSGDDAAANVYAANAWQGMTASWGQAYTITSITTNATGLATATLSEAPSPPITTGAYKFAVWGVSTDLMNGAKTVLAVPTSTTFTYQTAVLNANFTESNMLGSAKWLGEDAHNISGRTLAQWTYFYDWCYDWLVANGHAQYARDQIKAGYWSSTPTRLSSQFGNEIRESDFHNYSSWSGTAILEAGVALFGDDALGAAILDEGAGYMWEGLTVRPAACCSDTFEYNLKKSIDVLTGGAMNWEGPTYWRAGTIRLPSRS